MTVNVRHISAVEHATVDCDVSYRVVTDRRTKPLAIADRRPFSRAVASTMIIPTAERGCDYGGRFEIGPFNGTL